MSRVGFLERFDTARTRDDEEDAVGLRGPWRSLFSALR